jgi:hypothetical protein
MRSAARSAPAGSATCPSMSPVSPRRNGTHSIFLGWNAASPDKSEKPESARNPASVLTGRCRGSACGCGGGTWAVLRETAPATMSTPHTAVLFLKRARRSVLEAIGLIEYLGAQRRISHLTGIEPVFAVEWAGASMAPEVHLIVHRYQSAFHAEGTAGNQEAPCRAFVRLRGAGGLPSRFTGRR